MIDIEMLTPKNVLVVGDIILDEYIYGEIHRISPEAPVPVVLKKESHFVLGGAANVANNIISLGGKCTLIGHLGNDPKTELISDLICGTTITSHLINVDKRNTVKTRVVASGKQVVRLDEEDCSTIERKNDEIIQIFQSILEHQKYDGVVFQDYDKGFFNRALINKMMDYCSDVSIPTFIDPKKNHFWDFQNATVFKPNEKELLEAISQVKLDEEALKYSLNRLQCETLICTRAEKGIAYYGQNYLEVGTEKIEVLDVSGAGDSTLACLVIGYLNGLRQEELCQLGNAGGAAACRKNGVSVISLEDLNLRM